MIMKVYVIFEKDERFYNELIFKKVVGSEEELEESLKKDDFTYKEHEMNLDHVFDSKIKALEHKCNVEGFEHFHEMRRAEDELRCLKVAKRLLNNE